MSKGIKDTTAASQPKPSKKARLDAMLRRPRGATQKQLETSLGWQPHTVRGAISGALRQKLGLGVTSEKIEGRGRVYSLPPA